MTTITVYSVTTLYLLTFPFHVPPTDDVSHLWEAVFMLEYARSNGTNHQCMLLLMKLYGHLGATECITMLFQALNIKHLQMDTLG